MDVPRSIPGSAKSQKFVYALIDAETKIVRYVGCASNPRQRVGQHLWEAIRLDPDPYANSAKYEWLAGLRARGLRPEVLILEEIPPGVRWVDRETYWINVHRSPYLTNFERPPLEGEAPRTAGWNGGRYW
jgi:hypothetical protein